MLLRLRVHHEIRSIDLTRMLAAGHDSHTGRAAEAAKVHHGGQIKIEPREFAEKARHETVVHAHLVVAV